MRDHHGAAGGIGSATVAALRARGAKVLGLDLGADIDCDVRDQASVDAAVAAAVERLGGLDVLINNAGLGTPQSAGAAPDADALAVLDVNLVGPWRVTAAALGALRELARARGQRRLRPRARDGAVLDRLHAEQARRGRLFGRPAARVRRPHHGHDRLSRLHPHAIHARSHAAGVPLEGAVPAERVEDAARTLARAALGPPVRDLATTRSGGIGYALARLAPRRSSTACRRADAPARPARPLRRGIAGEFGARQ